MLGGVASQVGEDVAIESFGSSVDLRRVCHRRQIFNAYVFANEREKCAYKLRSAIFHKVHGNVE